VIQDAGLGIRDPGFKARIPHRESRIHLSRAVEMTHPPVQAQIFLTLSQSGNSMMVHCCTGLDLNRQDEPFFNDQQIGVQRGEVGRAFEIKVCPARERMAGERALPALAWAREEHGRKRAEEEPIIAPEHECTGRSHRWNKRAGCHL
jgi:hypothetical protein